MAPFLLILNPVPPRGGSEKNRSELLIRNLACFETGPEGPGLEGQQRKLNLRSQSGAHARLVRTGTVKQ
jgi:hypothetical protein